MHEIILPNKLEQQLADASTRIRFILKPGEKALGYFVPAALYDVFREEAHDGKLCQLERDQLSDYGGLTEATLFLNESHQELGIFVPETEVDIRNGQKALESIPPSTLLETI